MKRRKKVDGSLVWACQVCCLQMVGGLRCDVHNPTPEQRLSNPEQYRREAYAPSSKKAPA